MEEKIYQAQSMMEALEKVQDEMGPEAIVVSVREIQSPAWSLQKKSLFEIKAAPAGTEIKPKSPPEPVSRPLVASSGRNQPAKPAAAKSRPPANLPLADDSSSIEWLVEEKSSAANPAKRSAQSPPTAAVSSPRLNPPPFRGAKAAPILATEKSTAPPVEVIHPAPEMPASLLKLEISLAAQDLDPVFLKRLFRLACESMSPQSLKNEELVRKYLASQLQAELRVAPSHDLKPPAPIVCLVGTSGSGKTSMAARMASHYGSRLMKKVVWICADVIRAGAIAEARTYTDALGLPLTVIYSPADLKQALNDASGADLTLIDLPGYNPLVETQVEELGTFLTEIPNRSLLLVASASQKEKDLFQAAASFGIFGLNGLVITKMDETLSVGSVYNLAQKSQIPLMYFSSGKGTTGSFQSASAEGLVSALFHHGDF